MSASVRRAFIAFVAVEIVGFFVYLAIGRHMWFYGDEWYIIAGPGMRAALGPYGGHLIAFPFAVWRFMYLVIGLRSYVPYLMVVIGLHLATAALLRAIMRRAGVGPWIATAAASLYVFFGAGSQDTLWAFQMTFLGAVVFGLAQLLLSDHDGPLDRRDWLGLGCGFLAILCSGVAVTMVAIVGIAALIRGRWFAAVVHTVPLGLVWAVWSWRYGDATAYVTTLGPLYRWDRRGIIGTFRSLGRVAPVGWALAAMLIVGLVFAVKQRGPATRRARLVLPLSTLLGAVVFLTITGATRAEIGIQFAESSRYLDVVAVLILPAIAVAADALVRRYRVLLPVVLAVLLIGIPGNVSAASHNVPEPFYFARFQQAVRSLPRMALAKRVPASLHPFPNDAPTVTLSFLLRAARSGRLPATRRPTAHERVTNLLRLSLAETSASKKRGCDKLDGVVAVHLRKGQEFFVKGTVVIQLVRSDGRSDPLVFGAGFLSGGGPHRLLDVGGPLALRVGPLATAQLPVKLCNVPASGG